ncbi:MAG TPA: hypothetical protein VI775_01330 [Candidatus Paceibacterota bacterium]
MKKSVIIIVVLIALGLIVWVMGKDKAPVIPENVETADTVSTSATETTKVSSKISEYKNDELGFSVKYPTIWEAGTSDYGISFIIPYDKSDTNTLKRLETRVVYVTGKCAFPPVTTVKDRDTLKSGDLSFNMISMDNSVSGINYFDRMYSLQKDANTCFIFSFSSIYINPANKGFKGSEATQVLNNSKTLIAEADKAFTEMVKSFSFLVGPKGQDEAKIVPIKK